MHLQATHNLRRFGWVYRHPTEPTRPGRTHTLFLLEIDIGNGGLGRRLSRRSTGGTGSPLLSVPGGVTKALKDSQPALYRDDHAVIGLDRFSR